MKKTKRLNIPLNKNDVLSLHAGDMVLICGIIVTGRDKIHKFLYEEMPSTEQIPFNLAGTIIYHCGPIIKKTKKGYDFIAGGPTTSMRVEMYEHRIISKYGLRGIMGKGGMGKQTLNSLKENGCIYLHTIGGAAIYLAEKIKKVEGVWKLDEFGMSEAMWALSVEDFPAIVTMDAHGESIHDKIEKNSLREFKRLIP